MHLRLACANGHKTHTRICTLQHTAPLPCQQARDDILGLGIGRRLYAWEKKSVAHQAEAVLGAGIGAFAVPKHHSTSQTEGPPGIKTISNPTDAPGGAERHFWEPA